MVRISRVEPKMASRRSAFVDQGSNSCIGDTRMKDAACTNQTYSLPEKCLLLVNVAYNCMTRRVPWTGPESSRPCGSSYKVGCIKQGIIAYPSAPFG